MSLIAQKKDIKSIKERPNIILIYLDDFNFYQLGSRNDDIYTPHLDQLENTGLSLSNAHITSSLCTPSRYGVLTGKYASRSQSKDLPETNSCDPLNLQFNTPITARDTTIGEAFQTTGYSTGFVGKYHLGFKRAYRVFEDDDPNDPTILTKLKINYDSLRAKIKSNGFDFAEGLYQGNVSDKTPLKLQYHNVDYMTLAMRQFLETYHSSNFFLYYSTTLAHGPNEALSLEKDDFITPTGVTTHSELKGDTLNLINRRKTIIDDVQSRGKKKAYLTWLDQGIGDILEELKSYDILDNTMIIFLSDHGSIGKLTCYNQATNVPFVLNWPSKSEKGFSGTSNELIANIDLFPTLLELVGAESIDQSFKNLDGRNFLSKENDSYKVTGRSNLLLEIGLSKAIINQQGWKYLSVRPPNELDSLHQLGYSITHNGKIGDENVWSNAHLAFPSYFDFDQLYYLNDDPLEKNNLYCDPNYRDISDQLKLQLNDFVNELPYKYGEFSYNINPKIERETRSSNGEDISGYQISAKTNNLIFKYGSSVSEDGWFSELPSGIIKILIEDSIGCSYNMEFTNTEFEVNRLTETPMQTPTIYPNPSNGLFELQTYGERIHNIELFNIFGKKILTYNLADNKSNLKIDLSDKANGAYFIRLETSCNNYALRLQKN